jgi:hypothetical protein
MSHHAWLKTDLAKNVHLQHFVYEKIGIHESLRDFLSVTQ